METWFAILETIKNQGSSIEYQVLRIHMLKDLFEDLDSQFWENDLNIAHKTIVKDKELNTQLVLKHKQIHMQICSYHTKLQF